MPASRVRWSRTGSALNWVSASIVMVMRNAIWIPRSDGAKGFLGLTAASAVGTALIVSK
jgi:hypothetical protein